MYIYKIINKFTGKIYIGQKSNQSPEKSKSYYGSGKYIKRAIKKYGKNNFIKEIVEECTSQSQLNAREQYWIEKLDSVNPDIGYNLQYGGLGGKHTIQSKKIMSVLQQGSNNNFYGKNHTKESKKLMSISKLGNKNPMYGKHLSDETKLKLSNAFKGRTDSKETKAKKKEAAAKRKYREVICTHCSKKGRGPNMTRYHFDNCKYLNNG